MLCWRYFYPSTFSDYQLARLYLIIVGSSVPSGDSERQNVRKHKCTHKHQLWRQKNASSFFSRKVVSQYKYAYKYTIEKIGGSFSPSSHSRASFFSTNRNRNSSQGWSEFRMEHGNLPAWGEAPIRTGPSIINAAQDVIYFLEKSTNPFVFFFIPDDPLSRFLFFFNYFFPRTSANFRKQDATFRTLIDECSSNMPSLHKTGPGGPKHLSYFFLLCFLFAFVLTSYYGFGRKTSQHRWPYRLLEF